MSHKAVKSLVRALVAVTVLATLGEAALAADKIVVLSPHRKSIQDEFVPAFKEHYKATYKTDVEVDWIDQGGTSDDIRFLRAKFEKNPATSGVDLFWGGGTSTFLELNRDKLLDTYTLPDELAKDIPETAAGAAMYDATKTWYASAMSSFGIFYNKKILKMDKLPEPATWEDLGKPEYKNQISLTDPRKSGSANTMNTIVLQSMGWDKGWELLTKIAGNTRVFTQSSSDPIKAVVSGDAATAMAIDFYATPKIDELGKDNLGFVLPAGKTVVDPDPIALVRGAPSKQVAERFIAFVLSAPAQKLLILAKGTPGGPKLSTLGRMAVNKTAYTETEGKRVGDVNPFTINNAFKVDNEKAGKMQRVFNDLVGAIHVDTHNDLKAAWEGIVKRGSKSDDIAFFSKSPVTEAEALALADKWGDDVLRNKTINEWVEFAKAKYKKLAEAKS